MERIIAPSILAADFNNLQSEIEIINQSKAQWLHCDVMDGVFVPNISFGTPVIQSISKISRKLIDVHLMTIDPHRHITPFFNAGAQNITIHLEVARHLHSTVYQIRNHGIGAGVSINPHTPVNLLEDIVKDVDLVLIMSVNPGFGGQKFIPQSLDKISQLKELILKKNSNASIQVDGGITLENAKSLLDAGANNLVSGTTIFKSDNPMGTIEKLLKA